jgi:Phosphoesterase family
VKRSWSAIIGTLALLAAALVCAPTALAASTSGNLIVNGDATAGRCTTDWTDATTLPGWTTQSGSPDLICSSVSGGIGYPSGATPDAAFYAPGDQGDGSVQQTVNVSSAASAIDGGGVDYDLSAWLGGWTTYSGYTELSLGFLSSAGRQLGTAALPTVTESDRGGQTEFLARSATGAVPAGTRSIVVTLAFTDSSSEAGYAEHMSLTLNTAVSAPALTPPPSSVPSYSHVFMIMMENTDYDEVVDNPTDTPYLHTLMSEGATMANYHAVYHPSDENYMAIAGGESYATGATYYPDIKDPNENIGDELVSAGKTWKAYEQGMGTPCNLTTQYDSYYEPDDAPFINYTDVSGNSASCQQHLFDTSRLTTDLASASTTPNFSWIAADDYYDGESSGNGSATSLQVQDGWLKQTVAPILASPAWTTQKSLLVITWDEDENEPDNHVAAIVLGSQGSVPAGTVSYTRYDHYSTGRTLEQALGIAPLTGNDEYATPLNDAFTGVNSTPPASTATPGGTLVAAGQALTVTYQTTANTANAQDWVGLYPLGVTPGAQSSSAWEWAAGSGGTATFPAASLPAAGTYALWYLYDDGYNVLGGPVDVTIE